MFCANCGKELPENAKFCGGCGAETETHQSTADAKKPKKEKKRTPLWLSLLVLVIFYLLGRFLVAPAMAEGPEPEEPEYQTEYCRLLYSRNIDAAPKEFEDQSLDYFALVSVDDDEIVDRMEFGYRKDSVREFINTIYYPISELDEAQVAAVDEAMRAEFDEYAGNGFCSVSYEIGKEYYIITLHFTGLDSSDNVRRLADLGFVEEGAERLSGRILPQGSFPRPHAHGRGLPPPVPADPEPKPEPRPADRQRRRPAAQLRHGTGARRPAPRGAPAR